MSGSRLTGKNLLRGVLEVITELLLDVDARSGRLREELDVFLAKHASHSKVLDQDLHDLAGMFHHRGVRGTGMEHAARHTPG